MRVVVTGASGFLGQAVLKQLRSLGVQPVGIARRPLPGLQVVKRYADTPRSDVLVHLAQTNDRRLVNEGGADAERAAEQTLADLLASGPSRVVYASSAVLYGDAAAQPHSPDDPIVVSDSYGRIKAASERMVLNEPAVAGVVARLVNLYGPGMARSNVLSHILAQVPNTGPLEVLDDTPVRDFLWVDDAARALALMAVGEARGIFNVGTGTATSVRQLALSALETCNQGHRPVHSKQTPARPSSLTVDPMRTQQAFGWVAEMPLAAGLRRLLSNTPITTP